MKFRCKKCISPCDLERNTVLGAVPMLPDSCPYKDRGTGNYHTPEWFIVPEKVV